MTHPTKFAKGRNPGTMKCYSCGKVTWRAYIETIVDATSGICRDCYEEAGYENAHSDGHHDAQPDYNCPVCREERDTAHVKE